jgi:hypothetical protein
VPLPRGHPMTAAADREARLAAALRANLRKRKAQARGRQDARAESADQPPGPADGRNPAEEARPAHRKDPASRKDP